MNYKLIYDKLIEKAKTRLLLNEYVESHHIIPKCIGGTNNTENLVDLKPEEHYVCHQLLVKIYPNNRSLLYAATMMCSKSPSNKRNNKLYGWLRRKMYNQVNLTCKECNNTFSIQKGRYNRDQTKFCSHKCYLINVKNQCDYSTFNCKICNIHFTIPSSFVREGIKEKACSKQCGIKLKQMKARVDLLCLNCNCCYNTTKSRGKNSKFCSQKCFREYKHKDAWITFKCLHCNTESKKLKSFSKGIPKFCSKQCFVKEKMKKSFKRTSDVLQQ